MKKWAVTQKTLNVKTTSYQRRCGVTSHRRQYDAVLTFYIYLERYENKLELLKHNNNGLFL